MWLHNVVIAILLNVAILLVLVKGKPVIEGEMPSDFMNRSLSPWLGKSTSNHSWPHSRPPGCWGRPWICRDREHPPWARMHCCRNQCVDVFSDPNNCGLCGIRCPFTWQCCCGFCVNTNISPFNCGKCGNRCPWGVRCVYGMCGYAQPWPHPPFPFPPPRPHPPMPFPPPRPRPPFPFPPKEPHPRPPHPWPPVVPHRPEGNQAPQLISETS